MERVYRTGMQCYGVAMKMLSAFHAKAGRWVRGRKHWRAELRQGVSGLSPRARLWVHCASLGEYEQARPLLQHLAKDGGYAIVLTFFSPSGYERKRNDPLADHVGYIPLDTPGNARDFVTLLRPCYAIFIRYEFWACHLSELRRRGIPHYLVSAAFRPAQPFFRPLTGKWFRQMLHGYTHIFTIDARSRELLIRYGIRNVTVAGDTRADRVLEIAAAARRIPLLETFLGGRPAIVCGSVWPQDWKVLRPSVVATRSSYQWILAPHEVDAETIRFWKTKLEAAGIPAALYSEEVFGSAEALIIDNIGMLSRLYQYADVAYVGGGFGKGIHNVLEPAAYGTPVLFGPRFDKFPEAKGLLERQGAETVRDGKEAKDYLEKYIQDEGLRKAAGGNARGYVQSISGAAARILKEIGRHSHN